MFNELYKMRLLILVSFSLFFSLFHCVCELMCLSAISLCFGHLKARWIWMVQLIRWHTASINSPLNFHFISMIRCKSRCLVYLIETNTLQLCYVHKHNICSACDEQQKKYWSIINWCECSVCWNFLARIANLRRTKRQCFWISVAFFLVCCVLLLIMSI